MTKGPSLEQWDRVQDLFDRASHLPREQRAAFVAGECAGDDRLRALVGELLGSITRSDEWFADSITPAIQAGLAGGDISPGARLGPYEILEKLGEGGMGQVFRARRDDDVFRKEVAIKVVPAAFASPALVERFRTERRILAALDHRNIARVLDGGSTPEGAPYLVMEYVPGLPLLQHCSQTELNVRERVTLFRTICDAVQYAHENLVVHRDLKPANVIVGSDGTAKLLDFGIAKLLEQEPGTGSLETRSFERLMTPEYASPEQIRGEPVTTATDVYSLGAMLYEMLSGQRPYALGTQTLGEMERIVTEQDARPLGQVRKELAGDLENIAAKAMQKQPAQRYRSAGQLSEDLGRYLDGFPVQARADSAWYKAGKFARRHKLPMAALTMTVAALATFLTLLVRERNATERERAAAERVVQFLVGSFSVADPSMNRGRQATARDILDNGVARIESELQDQPETMGRMLTTMGEVYGVVGEQKLAQRLLERAVAAQSDRGQRAAALKRLGAVQTTNGQWSIGEGSLRQAAAWMKSSSVEQADVLAALASNLRMQGKLDDAESTVQQALALMRRLRGEQHQDTADCLGILAQIRYDRADFAGALQRHRQALLIEEKAFGPVHRRVALRLNLIASALLQTREFQAAQQNMLRSLATFLKLYGEKQQDVATAWNDLSVIYSRQGKYDEAALANMESLRIYRTLNGDRHPFVVAALANLAQTRRRQEDVERAASHIAEAVEIAKQIGGRGTLEGAFAAYLGGVLDLDRGRFREAASQLREAARIRAEAQGPEHDSVLAVEGYLAIAHQGNGDFAAARAIYERMVGIAEKRNQSASLSRLTGLIGMAETFADAGDWKGVEATLDRLRPVAAKANAPMRARLGLVEGRWHLAGKRRAEAEASLRQAAGVTGQDAAIWRWLSSRGLARMNAGTENPDGGRFAGYAPAARMFEQR
ncbi:MAG: serine/threonine protein kinase [Acidobacteria bacterium]|nr:serine/threonine protein kinase [Acidobacteriota bacterium]